MRDAVGVAVTVAEDDFDAVNEGVTEGVGVIVGFDVRLFVAEMDVDAVTDLETEADGVGRGDSDGDTTAPVTPRTLGMPHFNAKCWMIASCVAAARYFSKCTYS